MHRSIILLPLCLTLGSLAACDDGAEDGPLRIAEGYGRLVAPAAVGDGVLVAWDAADEITYRVNGALVDGRGAVLGLGRLARVFDLAQDAWTVPDDDGAFVVSVQFAEFGAPYTVQVRRVAEDGAVGEMRAQELPTVPAAFGRVDGRLTLLRPEAGALVMQRFDGAAWGPATALDMAPCGCQIDLFEVAGQPVVITRTAERLGVGVFDRETGAALGQHVVAGTLRNGRSRSLVALQAAAVADGLRVVWLDGVGAPFTARALTVDADGALVEAPRDLLEVTHRAPSLALSPDGAWLGWSSGGGFTIAPLDALDAPAAELAVPVGERELWLVTVGGDLRALTATYAEEGEVYRMAVDLWPLPVAP